tara:strand:- start:2219 stop:2398 length:180 start_codon:yes stop_codon:yes gene_type:complete
MQFDRGNTTFDLQDTEFYDKYELFDNIKNSHQQRYHRKEIIQKYQQAGLWPKYKNNDQT